LLLPSLCLHPQVMRNGSMSMHAVDDVLGVTVAAPADKQQFDTGLQHLYTNTHMSQQQQQQHEQRQQHRLPTGKGPLEQQQQQQQQQVASRVLSITPLDSPLVSPGQPLVLPNVVHPPDLANHGVSFNLHNNLWGEWAC
jgi:hypothetical protein